MSYESLIKYLSSLDNISQEEKQKVLKFFKKNDYINTLREKASASADSNILMGYGDFNSKIVFIAQDESTYKETIPMLKTFMGKFGLEIWDIYLTFVDKSHDDFKNKYDLLFYEINAISPEIIYCFVKSEEEYNKIIAQYTKNKVELPSKIFYFLINEDIDYLNTEQGVLFNAFKYLINYK